MVSVWAFQPIGPTLEDDGVLRLSNGRSLLFDDIPGNAWTTTRLRKLSKAVQSLIDDVQPVADIPSGDLDEGSTPAELQSRYGGRRFLDGKGNITSRSTLASFTFEDGVLVPLFEVVR